MSLWRAVGTPRVGMEKDIVEGFLEEVLSGSPGWGWWKG